MRRDSPSIVIVLIDALRADCAPGAADSPHLRSLGLARPDLPALRALTDGACSFTQAVSCSGYTTPCVGSMLTGLLPPEHGVRAFDLTALSADVRTLPEILAAHGYATCAMTDQPPVLQPMGLLRGFQTLVPTEDEALAWWDSYAGAPRLLFLHLWDCHKPYGMPFGRRYRTGYAGIAGDWQAMLRQHGIAEPAPAEFLDEDEQRQRVYAMQFAWESALGFKAGLQAYIEGLRVFDGGRLRDLADALRQRRVAQDAIVIVLADHGEGRDRPPSRRMTHDMSLAEDIVRIPLFIRLPGGSAARTVGDQVSQADLTPTLLDLLGMEGERTPPRSAWNGRSLAPLLHGQTLPPRAAYAEVTKLNNDPLQRVGRVGGERVAALHARVLRYPERKYRLAGQAGDPDAALLDGPADVVVREVCRRLLGRAETDDDRARLLPIVGDGTLPAERKLAALQAAIAATDEWRLLDKYAVYDLQRDPLETKPLDPRGRPTEWQEFQQQLAIMDAIDAGQRPGSSLLTNEADEQLILKRLQDLGYVE